MAVSHSSHDHWLGTPYNLLVLLVAVVGVVIAGQTDHSLAWAGVIASIATASLFAWWANHRRYRLIHDTPLSKIASAAQGFVELSGQLYPIGQSRQTSLLSHTPCLWFHCIVRVKRKNEWETELDEVSDAAFLLDDGSGACLIDPKGAEITSQYKKIWYEGERSFTEYLFLEHDTLYALGEFTTLADPRRYPGAKHLLNEVLDSWKRDRPALLAQFDSNQDGDLDSQEWERVRASAWDKIKATFRLDTEHSGLHLLQRPRDGRPYLLSTHPNTQKARVLLIWSWIHISVFLLACGALAYSLSLTFEDSASQQATPPSTIDPAHPSQ